MKTLVQKAPTLGHLVRVVLAATFLPASLAAQEYRKIEIDGKFDDWKGVTPLVTFPEGSPTAYDLKEVSMVNDADYYYLLVKTYPKKSGDPEKKYSFQILVDRDMNRETGSPKIHRDLGVEIWLPFNLSGWAGGRIFEDGKFRDFPVKGISIAPMTTGVLPQDQFEMRIPRNLETDKGERVFSEEDFKVIFRSVLTGQGGEVHKTSKPFIYQTASQNEKR